MLEIVNLTKDFGKFRAVDNLSLKVNKGEIVGLLGPNGAGKTTTFKILAGLLKPTAGTVIIGGWDILKNPEEAKRLFGYIPDRPYIYEKLTGREYMEFVADLHTLNDSRDRIHYLLELFDLKYWEDELVEGYSHGMRQRLAFASALLHKPPLLVVDEPIVGLDPKGARLIKGIFMKMKNEGMSILMSTHILEIAEELCDRLCIMNEGKIVAEGTLEEIRKITHEKEHKLEPLFLKLTGGSSVEETIRALRI